MKFIEERRLKEAFWDKYGYRSNILRYQFESPARNGGIDLLTVEEYQDRITLVAFEFKLDDIKKALAQAEEDLIYAHKSFIVIPSEKIDVVNDKYLDWIRSKRYIGVIGVDLDGRWHMSVKAQMQADEALKFNQVIAKMLLNIIK